MAKQQCPHCPKILANSDGLSKHLKRFSRRANHPEVSAEPPAPLQPDLFTGGQAQLQEKDDRIAELEAQLESRGIADYPGEVQASYLLESLTRLQPETVAVLVAKAGKESILREATAAELAQADDEPAQEFDPATLPAILPGRSDNPGYRFLEELGVSIKA